MGITVLCNIIIRIGLSGNHERRHENVSEQRGIAGSTGNHVLGVFRRKQIDTQ